MSKPNRPEGGAQARASRRWPRWWDRHFKIIDPFVAALVAGVVVWAVVLRDCDHSSQLVTEDGDMIFATGAGISGALLGLSIAALALLADHIGKPHILERLSRKQREDLLGAFVSSIAWLGLATLVALGGLLVSGVRALQVLLAAWLFTVVISTGYLIRAIDLLRVVVFASVVNPATGGDGTRRGE
jgi:hypothetical protein